MKRLLIYFLVAITLVSGVTASSGLGSRSTFQDISQATHKQSPSDSKQFFFTSPDFLISVGIGNEQTSLIHSLQNSSFRVVTSFLNSFRNYFIEKIVQQQFAIGLTVFLLKSAYKKLDGYYLYHLRKLLI